jgi:hypothetical protein
MKKKLPELHKQAFMFKNSKRLQHDGGRAWSGDSQLQLALRGGNGSLVTIHQKKNSGRIKAPDEHNPSF